MDLSCLNGLDIFDIYRRYCEIRSGTVPSHIVEGYGPDGVSQKVNFSKEALNQLGIFVESRIHVRVSLFHELSKLMSRLELIVDFTEFSRFYDFVFFVCRENGQKNITVSKAVSGWRLVLSGRFQLLTQFCDFVEKNQRHNISEDTWRQVLSFSRIHEDLGGYDPAGAWPVLIDDFVEHMYRTSGPNGCTSYCTCGDSEAQLGVPEDPLPGMKVFPTLKRKTCDDIQIDELNFSDSLCTESMDSKLNFKRIRKEISQDEPMEMNRHNSPLSCSKSPCAVEGCLTKGIAGLFSNRSCLQVSNTRGVSYT